MAASNGGDRNGGRVFGAPLKRTEDPRLLRGEGRYISDLKLHGMVHAAVLRSARARPHRLDRHRGLSA